MLPLHKVENGLDAAQHAANYSRAAVSFSISAVEKLERWRPRGWIFKARTSAAALSLPTLDARRTDALYGPPQGRGLAPCP